MAVQIKDLTIAYRQEGEVRTALSSVTLDIGAGEILGVVGESGCGKSTMALSILRLLPENAEVVSGSILSEGVDLLQLPLEEMPQIRGKEISMIFQDPFTALNPVLTIGNQLAEATALHQKLSRWDTQARVIELLRAVEIREPERRIFSFPHQLSGGERQRVLIAMAIAGRPKLLVADEPTTALDVTVQKEILELIQKLRKEFGMSILLITHNFGIIAQLCDRVAVMYAGRLVEVSQKEAILSHPLHPYTRGLLQSIPRMGHQGRLPAIPGRPPDPMRMPRGCTFAPRCAYRIEKCEVAEPDLAPWEERHWARCIRVREIL